MTPLITLTTDFGYQGPFVAVMKGVILGRCPQARIVDLTHEIPVHWPVEAGFWLARSWPWFPAGSLHVAVVDPGVGTSRDIVVAEHEGHVFLAPDNGLLAPVVGLRPARCFRLTENWRRRQDWPEPSSTFHGRDIFAPLVAALAMGEVQAEAIGPQVDELMPAMLDEPEAGEGEIRGTIIAIDNFGNLISNIDASHLQRFRVAEVLAGGQRMPLRRTYGDCRPGEYLALVNSFDALEIARAQGSAAESLGMGRGAPVIVRSMVR